MTFYVGQPVECIDASGAAANFLVEGAVYIVTGFVDDFPNMLNVNCKPDIYGYTGYFKTRFRPIVEPKQEQSFTQGADPSSDKWDNRVRKPVRVKA